MKHSEMDMMSIIEYRARVERAASLKDGEAIYNGTTEHAQIVIENLFRTAASDVLVLNQSLNQGVYGHEHTIDAITEFLARPDAKICALVEEEPKSGWAENKFAKAFASNERVEIRQLSAKHSSLFDYHFTVVDGQSFRFEADKTKHAAIASFGDSEAGENLASIHKKLWGLGQKVEALAI